MEREALKLALEALEANYLLVNGTETHGGLEQCLDGYYSSCFDTEPINKKTEEAITSLRQAIAELESLERNFCPRCGKRTNDIHTCTPPQRTWVGLTDDEHCDIWYKESLDWMEYGKAIEAKLKERNDHSI
jgi:hypothetical protein